MPIDLAQFHETFYEESFEAIALMEQELLRLDVDSRDPELINTIFRAAHSIKGGAATFGFSSVSSFTHSLEALLDGLREERLQLTQPLLQQLLRSVDVLRGMLSAQRAQLSINPQQVADLQFEMERVCAQQRSPPSAPAAGQRAKAGEAAAATVVPTRPPVVPDDVPDADPGPAPGAGVVDASALRRYHISFRPLPQLLARQSDPLRLFGELAVLGELQVSVDVTQLPPLHELDPESCYLSWSLVLDTAVTREAIVDVFQWAEGDCALDVTALEQPDAMAETGVDSMVERHRAPRSAVETPRRVSLQRPLDSPPVESAEVRGANAERITPAQTATSSQSGDATSLRVSVAKIDQLMNSVSELVITQSMLAQLGMRVSGGVGESLRSGLEQLERHVRDLQEHVMRVRMVPIGFVFNRFPRMVRDLGQKLGKQVELKVSGSDTELDKSVLEKIGDPLTHLVRNCIDHGIEPPEQREAAGKPPRGVIQLHACHRGSSVRVEISDDGAGLDRARILDKARERGLVGASEQLSDEAVCKLIFVPGFSTNEQATLVSGRGVGMDVVRRNVETLGGRIELQSRPGRGTRFIITLPLTLAIVDGQTVAVGEESYIVPLTAIVESVQLRTASVRQLVGRGEVLSFRGEYVPVVRLAQLFGSPQQRERASDTASDIVMVVEADGRRIGLIVDELLGQQQVVVKTLETNYVPVEGIAGATILGDGSVALILDVERLTRSLVERLAA